MRVMEQYKKAFSSLPEEIKEAEVNGETHDAVTVFVTEEGLQNVQVSKEQALYIRVSGEKTGYYYTQNLEEDPTRALQTAYENSLYSEQTVPEIMRKEANEKICEEIEAIQEVSILERRALSLLTEIKEQMMLDTDQIQLQVSLKAETYGQHTVNSHGLDNAFTHPIYLLDVMAAVRTGEKIITSDVAVAATCLEELDVKKAGEELNLKCKTQLLPEITVESGEYPVILSNSVVYYLFGTGWQLFSGSKYVEGTTKLDGMLGQKLGTDCLTICDKTSLAGKGFPMHFDCEGNAGKDVFLLEQGVCKNLLHNQISSHALSAEVTGNAGRRPLLFGNIATDILVTPKNFCIMPGKNDLETMIKNMDNGILITESFDIFHTIDISSGDFSVPCWGIQIENGKEKGGILSMVMSGNILDLFSNVEEVGNHFMVHPMVAIENYGIGTCPLRLKKMTISG